MDYLEFTAMRNDVRRVEFKRNQSTRGLITIEKYESIVTIKMLLVLTLPDI